MRMLTVLFTPLFITAGLMAAPPVKVSVESARVVLGPGAAPQPGAASYHPRLDARFTLSGLPGNARPTFKVWRATEQAFASLGKGRAVRGGTGFSAVAGEVVALPGGSAYEVKDQLRTPWNGPEFLIIEVRNRGRLLARGTAPILELNLPAPAQREGMKP